MPAPTAENNFTLLQFYTCRIVESFSIILKSTLKSRCKALKGGHERNCKCKFDRECYSHPRRIIITDCYENKLVVLMIWNWTDICRIHCQQHKAEPLSRFALMCQSVSDMALCNGEMWLAS